jgi:hypothetical protein
LKLALLRRRLRLDYTRRFCVAAGGFKWSKCRDCLFGCTEISGIYISTITNSSIMKYIRKILFNLAPGIFSDFSFFFHPKKKAWLSRVESAIKS